jgi:hypothetical protein
MDASWRDGAGAHAEANSIALRDFDDLFPYRLPCCVVTYAFSRLKSNARRYQTQVILVFKDTAMMRAGRMPCATLQNSKLRCRADQVLDAERR